MVRKTDKKVLIIEYEMSSANIMSKFVSELLGLSVNRIRGIEVEEDIKILRNINNSRAKISEYNLSILDNQDATVADIEQLSEQKQDLIYQEETIPVEGTISLSKEIEIPVDFPTGEYTLNINAKFDGKNIPLTANFSVKTPWYAQRMLGIEKGIVAIIIIIIVLLCVILFLLDARSKRHKN